MTTKSTNCVLLTWKTSQFYGLNVMYLSLKQTVRQRTPNLLSRRNIHFVPLSFLIHNLSFFSWNKIYCVADIFIDIVCLKQETTLQNFTMIIFLVFESLEKLMGNCFLLQASSYFVNISFLRCFFLFFCLYVFVCLLYKQ